MCKQFNIKYYIKYNVFILILILSSCTCNNNERNIIKEYQRLPLNSQNWNLSPTLHDLISDYNIARNYDHRQAQVIDSKYVKSNSLESSYFNGAKEEQDENDDKENISSYNNNNNNNNNSDNSDNSNSDSNSSSSEGISYPDFNEPYGIPTTGNNVQIFDRDIRSGKHKQIFKISHFQPLCPYIHERVFLRDDKYIYRPDHYDEIICKYPYNTHKEYNRDHNKVCGRLLLDCVQLNRTIYLTKRAHKNTCWEPDTRLVRAGCECMWPKHHHDDIQH